MYRIASLNFKHANTWKTSIKMTQKQNSSSTVRCCDALLCGFGSTLVCWCRFTSSCLQCCCRSSSCHPFKETRGGTKWASITIARHRFQLIWVQSAWPGLPPQTQPSRPESATGGPGRCAGWVPRRSRWPAMQWPDPVCWQRWATARPSGSPRRSAQTAPARQQTQQVFWSIDMEWLFMLFSEWIHVQMWQLCIGLTSPVSSNRFLSALSMT